MRVQGSLGRLVACTRAADRRLLLRGIQTASKGIANSDSSAPSSSFQANSPDVDQLSSITFDYSTLLQSCSKMFGDETPLRSTVWRSRLKTAEESLQFDTRRPIRIAVVGASDSGASDLLTCLLDEPLSHAAPQYHEIAKEGAYDNQTKIKALLARNDTRKELHHRPLRIRYGSHLGFGKDVDEFTIPHIWLKENNVEVVEIINPTTTSTTLDELYRSDMILFVTDDLTLTAHKRYRDQLKLDTTLQLLRYFAHKPATRVLVNHIDSLSTFENDVCQAGLKIAIGTEAFCSLQRQTTSSSTPADRSNADVLMHTSFALASRANDSLRMAISQPESTATPKNTERREQTASAWSDFASLYTASGMVRVKAFMEQLPLMTAFANHQQGLNGTGGAVIQRVNYLIRQSLDQALYGISAEIEEVRQAQGAARVLREEVEAYKIKTAGEVFSLTRQDGPSRVHERAGDRSSSIEAATRDSRGFVERTFASRLPWWRIIWKVDDVRAETEAAVDRSFAKDVEKQLTFETGKLLHVAERLQQRTKSIFKLLNPTSSMSYRPLDSLERDHGTFQSAFHSPILLNELRQHSIDNVEKSLSADLLTIPIEKRRQQLLAEGGPVDVLCLRAQRSVLTTVAMVGSSGLISVVGALAGGPYGVGLPSICAPLAMQASTATGLFAFATTLSVWLLQTRWTRAKKRFWRQWEHIAEGLDVDLKTNLDNTFENVVGAQSVKGAAGLETLAKRRVEQIERLYDTVETVTSEIKTITSKPRRHP